MTKLLVFLQEFTFDTLIAVLSCFAAIIALFLGGKAYKNCQIKNNKFDGKKIMKNASDDHSQTAEIIIQNTYNGLQPTETKALLDFTRDTFKTCMDEMHKLYEAQTNENLKIIIEEANRIVQERKLELSHYTKIDWINVYFESAKNSSDEFMQNIWARVLAREIEFPGSFSYKTLDTLKSMDKNDFVLFEKICSCVINDFLLETLFTEDDFIVSWTDMLKMSALDLVYLNDTRNNFKFSTDEVKLIIGKKYVVILKKLVQENMDVNLSVYFLSSIGKELLSICDIQYDENIIKQIVKKMKGIIDRDTNNKIQTTLHRIFTVGNRIVYDIANVLENESGEKVS